MEKPTIAQKSPYNVTIEANKNYAWCACGKSNNQPFCDGKHKGSGMSPKMVKFDESKEVWWCGCKHTNNDLGLCDGNHKNL
jgi:CDGSH-type Zn-finger protein